MDPGDLAEFARSSDLLGRVRHPHNPAAKLPKDLVLDLERNPRLHDGHRQRELLIACLRNLCKSTKSGMLDEYAWITETNGAVPQSMFGSSIASRLDDLRNTLIQVRNERLQVCAINAASPQEMGLRIYKGRFRIWMHMFGQETGHLAVRRIVELLVQQHWQLSPLDVLDHRFHEMTSVSAILPLLELPSRRRALEAVVPPGESQSKYIFEHCAQYDHRDVYQHGRYHVVHSVSKHRSSTSLIALEITANCCILFPGGPVALPKWNLEWKWLREVPSIKQYFGMYDWSIYVWQPFAKPPSFTTLQMLDASEAYTGRQRVVLTSSCGSLHHRLRDICNNVITSSTSKKDCTDCIVPLGLEVSNLVTTDVESFVCNSIEKLHELTLLAREHPSASKIQYLLHLQECLQLLAENCIRNASIARTLEIQLTLPLNKCLAHLYGKLESSADLVYLAEQAKEAANRINSTKAIITEQIDLAEKRRSRIVGVFIAIYVPLAFTTSFFGMNIEDNATSYYWTNTTSTNRSMANYTGRYGHHFANNLTYYYYDYYSNRDDQDPKTTLPTSENSMLISSDVPDSVRWKMWQFGVTAGLLTFGSIILPIVSGWIVRWFARFSTRHRTLARFLITFLYLGFFGLSLYPFVIPGLYLGVPAVNFFWFCYATYRTIRIAREQQEQGYDKPLLLTRALASILLLYGWVGWLIGFLSWSDMAFLVAGLPSLACGWIAQLILCTIWIFEPESSPSEKQMPRMKLVDRVRNMICRRKGYNQPISPF